MKNIFPTLALLATCALVSAEVRPPSVASSERPAGINLAGTNLAGINLDWMDRTVRAPDDFYQFANGKWLAGAKIPSDEPDLNTFTELQERVEDKLHALLDGLAARKDLKPGSIERKVADFYRVALDDSLAQRLGVTPISPLLAECDGATDPASVVKVAAHLDNEGVASLFGSGIEGDALDSRKHMFTLAQGGIGLPDRDYYLNDDGTSKLLRNLYKGHIARSFELLGISKTESAAAADKIMAIETRLAKASRPNTAMRDVKALVHKVPLAQVESSSKVTPWADYFKIIGLPHLAEVNVATPEFFTALDKSLTEVSIEDWRLYLKWHVLSTFSGALTKAFRDENFTFTSVLTGQQQQPPAWKRALAQSEVLGFPIGKLYVAEAFSPAAKQKAHQLVVDLIASFHKRIEANAWMSPATKAEALKKLAAIKIKVGYPDKWPSLDKLEVKDDSLVANILRAQAFAHAKEIREFYKRVDRGEWGMTPQTVNAYYNPQNNEIVFPAAILQPPFFDPNADDASNFGAIGTVIGHEMTHGFDDQGRTFDAKGNLRDWWTADDAKAFKALTDQLVKQYSQYTAVGKIKVNGELTVGENIADLGGIHIAYDALQARLKKSPQPLIGGFTPEQRFFIAFAQNWRMKISTQFAELLAKLDAHSPDRIRVLGVLVNMPEFVPAFGQASGNGPDRPGSGTLKIW